MAKALTQIKRFFFPGVVLAVALWLGISWLMKASRTDEEVIRDAIATMARGAEERSASRILDPVSDRYKDTFHQDIDELHRTATSFCLRYRNVDVTLSEIKIKPDPDNPQEWLVDLNASVKASTDPDQEPTEEVLTPFRNANRIRLHFRREEDGDIRLVTVTRPEDDED